MAATFAGAVTLTLSNPAPVLSFIGVFGALAGSGAPVSPAVMVAGVLTGSALMLAAFARWQWGS